MPFFHDGSEELRDLNQHEKTIINLTIVGSFFTCFDFIIYYCFYEAIQLAFFANLWSKSWQNLGFFLIMAIGYMARPIGGIIMADIGDRLGRKPVMIISLSIVMLSSLLIGVLPTYEQAGMLAVWLFVGLRFIQGLGFGAEVPTSWVYLAEHMPRWHIGSVCGRLISGFILAILFGSMLSAMLSSMLTPIEMVNFGWRIPFLIGGVGLALAIALRYQLTESPIWLQAKAKQQLLPRFPLKNVWQKYHYGLSITIVLSWFTANVYLIVLLLLPSIAVNYFDVNSNLMAIANGVGILFAGIGSLLFGYLSDRFNYGRVLILGCIGLAIASMVFFSMLRQSSELLLISYTVLGFFAGIVGIIPGICVRLFPVENRLSGIAFCYNMAQAITGSIMTILLFYFSEILNLSTLLYLVFLCVIGVIIGLFLTNLHGLYRIEVREIQ